MNRPVVPHGSTVLVLLVVFVTELCVLRTFGGCRLFTDVSSARNLSLNFFGTDCAQVFNFPSCPNVRNTHG
eukprot:COSAG02_NODE_47213_length_342_cov_169.358025_1_plen_70_part_10